MEEEKIEINNRQGKTILIVPFRDRLSVIGEGEILARAEVHFARFYFFNCNELFLHEYLRFLKKSAFYHPICLRVARLIWASVIFPCLMGRPRESDSKVLRLMLAPRYLRDSLAYRTGGLTGKKTRAKRQIFLSSASR